MATVKTRLDNWALAELRGHSQINYDVLLQWYNKGLHNFQKALLEYASGLLNTSVRFQNIQKGKDEYDLPLGLENVEDFYSIIQLRVAYGKSDKFSSVQKYSNYNSGTTYYRLDDFDYIIVNNPSHGDLTQKDYYIKDGNNYIFVPKYSNYNSGTTYYKLVGFDSYQVVTNPEHADLLKQSYYILEQEGTPIYRVCYPIDFGEYNIQPLKNQSVDGKLKIQGGQQIGDPALWKRISMRDPRYVFISKNKIKIFPTPIRDVNMGLTLAYNYMEKPIENINYDEDNLNLPWFFFDAIEDYLSYMLYLKENPELAEVYLRTFETTLHDNIYGLNRDQRASEENFANLSYFYVG